MFKAPYRLLHILPDEKVVDTFISMLEDVYPGESLYVVFGEGPKPSLVKNVDKVIYYPINSRAFRLFLRDLSSFERVILHSLSPDRPFRAIHHPDITGVFWGADLYETLLVPRGYPLYYGIENLWEIRAAGRLPAFVYRALILIRDRIHYYQELSIVRRLKRICIMQCDAKLLIKYFPRLSFNCVPDSFSYYPIEQLIGKDQLEKECVGKNIWVNNSPALNGNHESVFRQLGSFVSDFRVISPISYGQESLRRYVEKQGYRYLGDRFVPLKEFLPAEEYYHIFLSANSFIFGHMRQCGYGNILVALYFGAKCFFYKRNPLYSELKSNNLTVFSIEDDLTEEFALSPLTQELRQRNRKIVMNLNSRKVLLERLRVCFE